VYHLIGTYYKIITCATRFKKYQDERGSHFALGMLTTKKARINFISAEVDCHKNMTSFKISNTRPNNVDLLVRT